MACHRTFLYCFPRQERNDSQKGQVAEHEHPLWLRGFSGIKNDLGGEDIVGP